MNEFDYKGWVGGVLDNYTSTSEFPSEGSENTLYIVRNSGTAQAYVWDDETSAYVVLAGGGGGGGEQADWNINDASSAAYVKNRTHWEGESVAFEGQYCLRGTYFEQIMADACSIDVNKTYTVTANGQTYSGLVPFISEPEPGVELHAIGNKGFMSGNEPVTSEVPILYGAAEVSGQVVALLFTTFSKGTTINISEDGSSDAPWEYTITGAEYSMIGGSPQSEENPVSYSNQTWKGYYNEVNVDQFDIEENKHYPVTFNGAEYDCQATAWQYPLAGLYLSDGLTLNDSTFFFGKVDDSGNFIYGIKTGSKEENEWLGIEIDNITVKNNSVHKLDSKYLPSAISNIPSAPSSDGTYTLQVTVNNGTITYSWVATS